ncbi:lipoate--protein ligase family protein [Bacillus solitudinis]|uniref:lipoate--protein ligase family protein n=1 Tax=Bacillus solitudinis TaxID=2014074 RepID=UPI000C24FD28|nr:biotin/lipoate A/B protein ligase family protein [Bacillus solitudinis]
MDVANLFTSKWRFLDHTTFGAPFQALQSFAYDDTLCTVIGQQQSSFTLRAWVHHDTIVLGTQDSRLPIIEKGVSYLEEKGYDVIVRNSGGLAVVLDSGVLNLSLIMKEDKSLSINTGYDAMLFLIQEMFKSATQSIEAREIIGSYCPGSYDLSIEGKKFAGISQRRIRGGVAVQIYLSVNGSGSERAKIVREFYKHSVQNETTKFDVPNVIPDTMASLSELLEQPLTIQDVLVRALTTLKNFGAELEGSSLTEDERLLFGQQLERVTTRNDKCLTKG